MTHSDRFAYGLRTVGGVDRPRKLVKWEAAFAAHAGADPRLDVDQEQFLSAFRFDRTMAQHIVSNDGSTAGFAGEVWCPWCWIDIDRDAPDKAADAARRLGAFILERYAALDERDLSIFFSGKKGYHLGVPLPPDAEPSGVFHLACRRFATALADAHQVAIDTGVYDRVRVLRSPNSRHGKSRLFKVRLEYEELMSLTADGIKCLAKAPRPFDPPQPVKAVPDQLAADWRRAVELAEQVEHARGERNRREAENGGPTRLQRATLEYIASPPSEGEREVRLFRAAGNLREFGASEALIVALLEDSALDSGLPPREISHAIRSGVEATDRKSDGGGDAG